jgi:hypothetical protein
MASSSAGVRDGGAVSRGAWGALYAAKVNITHAVNMAINAIAVLF